MQCFKYLVFSNGYGYCIKHTRKERSCSKIREKKERIFVFEKKSGGNNLTNISSGSNDVENVYILQIFFAKSKKEEYKI